MDNKNFEQFKKSVPAELSDDQLDKVSGGAFGDLVDCPVCGKKMREGYLCSWCDMADGVATCHKCGGEVTRERRCSGCGISWAVYYRETKWLRGENDSSGGYVQLK